MFHVVINFSQGLLALQEVFELCIWFLHCLGHNVLIYHLVDYAFCYYMSRLVLQANLPFLNINIVYSAFFSFPVK